MTPKETRRYSQEGIFSEAIDYLRQHHPEQFERFMGNRLAGVLTGFGALLIGTVVAARTYQAFREAGVRHKKEEEKDGLVEIIERYEQRFEEALAQDESKRPRPSGLLSELATDLVDYFDGGKGVDVRELYRRVIRPAAGFAEETQAIKSSVGEAGLEPGGSRIYKLFERSDFTVREFSRLVKGALRDNLRRKGYEVVPAGLRNPDWEKIGEIMQKRWKFPTLSGLRHGLTESIEPFGPESLIFPQGCLAIIKATAGADRKVVGYVTFLALKPEGLDLEELTFDAALEKRKEEIEGSVIMVTSVTIDKDPSGKDANLDAVSTGILSLEDLAEQKGAEAVIAPALSPHQEKGKSYQESWPELDQEGVPRDRWHNLLIFFAVEGGPVTEDFMSFEIQFSELLDLLKQQEGIDKLGTKKQRDLVNRIFKRGTYFLGASPVPIMRKNGKWMCSVPAGWLYFYKQGQGQSWDLKRRVFRRRAALIDP